MVMRSMFRRVDLIAIPTMTNDDVEGWDSLSHSLFLIKIEQAFGVRLPMAAVLEMQNIGDLVTILGKTPGVGIGL